MSIVGSNMQVHSAGTDILLVHRRVESGCSGEQGSTLEDRWQRWSPGISFGESGESRKYANTCKCVGSLAWIRIVNRRPE